MCLLKIFYSKNKIKLFASLFFSYFFVISCVGPAEYNDGLLENLPAIINEKDYFITITCSANYCIVSK